MKSESHTICSQCGELNRGGAKFCASCGGPTTEAHENENTLAETLTQGIRSVVGVIKKAVGLTPDSNVQRPDVSSREAVPTDNSSLAPTMPIAARQKKLPVKQPGDSIDTRFIILKAYPLQHSNFYDVFDHCCMEQDCKKINTTAANGICSHCHRPLRRYLVRETPLSRGYLNETEMRSLSKQRPHIIAHHRFRELDGLTYVWLSAPGIWKSLARVRVPARVDQVIAWVQQIGNALAGLGDCVLFDADQGNIECFIVDNGVVRLADLSSCRRVEPVRRQEYLSRDILFLARTMFYLATGENLERNGANMDRLSPALQGVIARSARGEYSDIDSILEDLDRVKTSYSLGIKPVSGKASDVGRVRDVNEDSLLAFEMTRVQESRGVPIGFYLVADGMGGHQAGEIASRTVNLIISERILNAEVIPGLKSVTRRLDETPGGILTAAIQEANKVLFEQAKAIGSDMGTTITAALVIGDTATIANVGDSRTYLLRNSSLKQVSTDHSLVASLVAAGIITLEEAATHPQRSQIYRTLGGKATVDVDVFTEHLAQGDKLILCSDGLTDMVPDSDITRIVSHTSVPQAACDALVWRANEAGGADNITIIIIKME